MLFDKRADPYLQNVYLLYSRRYKTSLKYMNLFLYILINLGVILVGYDCHFSICRCHMQKNLIGKCRKLQGK